MRFGLLLFLAITALLIGYSSADLLGRGYGSGCYGCSPYGGSQPGDVNRDCVIDIFDLAAVGLAYGSQPGDTNWNPQADLNRDGGIDILDLATVGINYGRTC